MLNTFPPNQVPMWEFSPPLAWNRPMTSSYTKSPAIISPQVAGRQRLCTPSPRRVWSMQLPGPAARGSSRSAAATPTSEGELETTGATLTGAVAATTSTMASSSPRPSSMPGRGWWKTLGRWWIYTTTAVGEWWAMASGLRCRFAFLIQAVPLN